MNVTMTREEIREVLSVSETALKHIVKAKKLKAKLHDKGLDLITTYRIGRSTIYEVLPIKLDYWEKIQIHYNIKKKNEHDKYTVARLSGNGLKSSRTQLIKENSIDISGYTAKKFDDILENEGYIMKDKIVYVYYNKRTGEFKEITEQEYKNFWNDVSYCKELLMINRSKLNKYEISQDTYDYRNFTILDAVGKEKGEIAMKFDTYKELKDTISLVEMIKKRCKK